MIHLLKAIKMNSTQHTAHSTQHTAHSTQHTSLNRLITSLVVISFLIGLKLNAQTASFTPGQLFKIQNPDSQLELGSSNACVTTSYLDPITMTMIPITLCPIGSLPYYNFKTDKTGYAFDKNIISTPGKFSTNANALSFNFMTTTLFGTPTAIPAMFITKVNGKVGIGHISATTIEAKLHVKSTTNVDGLRVNTTHTVDWLANTWLTVNRNNTQAFKISNNNYSGTGAYKDVFRVMGDGTTSIGDQTAHPSTYAKANVYGNIGQIGLAVSSNASSDWTPCIQAVVKSNSHLAFGVYVGSTLNFMVTGDGNFSARGGKITSASFPDFVFNDDYKRMNFIQKENYIKTNKHLPYMPSAKDIALNGLDLGTSIEGITQNVEENTLDIMEIYKSLTLLKEENERLKLEILKLQNEKK